MRSISKFVCQQCGFAQVGWAGRCPNCQSWGSLVETLYQSKLGTGQARSKGKDKKVEVVELIKVKGEGLNRLSSGIGELDRVLGGGIVPGQTVLLAGEPGIGKSTLLSQVAEKLYPKNRTKKVLYISGEESKTQIKLRAKRLAIKAEGIFIIEETDVDGIISQISQTRLPDGQVSPIDLVIVDSIQTLSTEDLSGWAGSVGQVRECASRLIDVCKKLSTPLFLVGHVTKEGAIAGPRILEHMVDTLLWFEGDRSQPLRILRSVKNRFGPTDEVGIFAMEERGLLPVSNPSQLFLSEIKNVPGSVPTVVLSGTRPVVVEIQALCVPTKLPFPRRTVQGVDNRRVELILAVLTRRLGLELFNFDVFVNAVGGIGIREPAADLAIALALASSFINKPLPPKTLAFGEVGLLGEVRNVPQEAKRIKEARTLGFRNIITGNNVRTLGEAVKKFIGHKQLSTS